MTFCFMQIFNEFGFYSPLRGEDYRNTDKKTSDKKKSEARKWILDKWSKRYLQIKGHQKR